MQQKAHPFLADGAQGSSIHYACPQTEKTTHNHLSGMRSNNGNHPDHDTETTGQSGRIPYMIEKGGSVM